MRIACIHIPQFALQCATRLDPSLRGAPVVVVSGVEPGREKAGPLHAPIVLACSRAAWAMGVRLGMTATAARALAPEAAKPGLAIVSAESGLERDAVRAIADSVLALSPVVDLGGRVGAGGAHLAMYAEVPAKTRGTSFGDRLIELLEELGFSARIGIADDRFTAWVAAAHAGAPHDEHGVVSVPRGGSAAFLSPRPLSLLAITPEVQHMLEALGVRTLGEFAALPAPSVSRPLEADYRGLARGESGATLRPYAPDAPVREEIVVSAQGVLAQDGAVDATAAIHMLARRIAHRLAGRTRGAARLDVFAERDGGPIEIPIEPPRVLSTNEDLARALSPVLDAGGASSAWRLRVVVSGEALVDSDGAAAEVFAEGSSPFARAIPGPARNSNESIYARDASELRDLSSRDQHGRGMSSAHAVSAHSLGADPLSVVLASTGSLFSLSSPDPREARRESHRRTRRGKQRRGRPTAPAQPRLFDSSSSK
jgi:nucleotidyltransferase/DNA polymerase involved in DNA repair